MVGSPPLRPKKAPPVDVQHNNIPLMGLAQLLCQFLELSKNLIAVVADIAHDLLGIDWIDQFGLWEIPAIEFCNHIQKCSPVEWQNWRLHLSRGVRRSVPANNGPLSVREGPPDADGQRAENLQTQPQRAIPAHAPSKIITPIRFSPFSAPFVIVRKASGALWTTVDA